MKLRKSRAAAMLMTGAMAFTTVFSSLPAATGLGALEAKAEETGKPLAFASARTYGSLYTDSFKDIAYTKDGGFAAVGYTFGDSDDPGWDYTEGTGSSPHANNDGVIVKFAPDGSVEWSEAIGTTSVDVLLGVDVLEDGRIAAIGYNTFKSDDGLFKGTVWLLRLINPSDPTDYVEYRIGGGAGDQGLSLAATSDGGVAIAGWTASKQGYITSTKDGVTYTDPVQIWQEADGTDENLPRRLGASSSESVVVKIDKEGQVQFCSLHNYGVMEDAYTGSSPQERLTAAAVDQDDNIIITGYRQAAKSVYNSFLAKLDGKTGSLIWHKESGSTVYTAPADLADYYSKNSYNSLDVLKDNSIVVMGYCDNDPMTEPYFDVLGGKDVVIAHYGADGSPISAESIGTIDDNDSRMEGITADVDGGYYVYGSHSGLILEDSEVKKGYNWGNYGGQDAIIVKYDANDKLVWSENYGTSNGDWFNAMAVDEEGNVVIAGESNGKFGMPVYDNIGGMDAFIASSRMLEGAYTDPYAETPDQEGVVWADGTYEGTGTGYGGEMTIAVTVEDHKITTVENVKNNDTAAYFRNASEELFWAIPEYQTPEVDVVAGATMSSNGIIEAARHALNQASARTVEEMISALGTITSEDAGDEAKKAAVAEAVAAYNLLGSYSASCLGNFETLQAAAQVYGIAIEDKTAEYTAPQETLPETGSPDDTYNDTYWKLQYKYMNNIHAAALADSGLTGEGVRIAVIDSGLSKGHKDIDYSKITAGYDYVNQCPMNSEEEGAAELYDDNGHGTAVTGILQAISGNEIGIAGLLSQAEIVPLKVSVKKNDAASTDQVARAITDAVDRFDVDVITTSLAVDPSDALSQAVEYAASKGVIITGASGNSGSAGSMEDEYIYPASYDQVISVGAVDQENVVRANSQKNDHVFVTAPGENMVLLAPSKGYKCTISSGTSYASPIVAAMAVAAKQAASEYGAEMNTETFKKLLIESSADAGEEGYDNAYGYGIIDMKAFTEALDDAMSAAKVSAMIAAIPVITADNYQDQKAAAEAARAAYEALSDEKKAEVANEKDLQIAEARIAMYEAMAEAEAAKEALEEAGADDEETQELKEALDQAQEELENARNEVKRLKIQARKVTGLTVRSNKAKIRVEYDSLGSGYRYKIYLATSKNGKYTAVTNTALTKKNITTYLNKALESGRTYYVKVRGFKKVAGHNAFTQFSEVVKVKKK